MFGPFGQFTVTGTFPPHDALGAALETVLRDVDDLSTVELEEVSDMLLETVVEEALLESSKDMVLDRSADVLLESAVDKAVLEVSDDSVLDRSADELEAPLEVLEDSIELLDTPDELLLGPGRVLVGGVDVIELEMTEAALLVVPKLDEAELKLSDNDDDVVERTMEKELLSDDVDDPTEDTVEPSELESEVLETAVLLLIALDDERLTDEIDEGGAATGGEQASAAFAVDLVVKAV